MRAKLTPRTVESAKPEATPYEIHDTDLKGLLLRVQPSGIKAYVVTWGRGKRRTLGRHPVMTVAGARKAALAALSESAEHGAPLAVIASQKPAKAVETFGEFMDDRYAPHVLATAKAGKATVHCIKRQFGHLYGRKLTSITRADFDDFKASRLKAGTHPATSTAILTGSRRHCPWRLNGSCWTRTRWPA